MINNVIYVHDRKKKYLCVLIKINTHIKSQGILLKKNIVLRPKISSRLGLFLRDVTRVSYNVLIINFPY